MKESAGCGRGTRRHSRATIATIAGTRLPGALFCPEGQPYGVFVDNNLGSNRTYLRDLCLALRLLNKIWSAAVSIDVTDDPCLIRAMALAGCTGLFVGFESLTTENLIDARKKTPTADDYGSYSHTA